MCVKVDACAFTSFTFRMQYVAKTKQKNKKRKRNVFLETSNLPVGAELVLVPCSVPFVAAMTTRAHSFNLFEYFLCKISLAENKEINKIQFSLVVQRSPIAPLCRRCTAQKRVYEKLDEKTCSQTVKRFLLDNQLGAARTNAVT